MFAVSESASRAGVEGHSSTSRQTDFDNERKTNKSPLINTFYRAKQMLLNAGLYGVKENLPNVDIESVKLSVSSHCICYNLFPANAIPGNECVWV